MNLRNRISHAYKSSPYLCVPECVCSSGRNESFSLCTALSRDLTMMERHLRNHLLHSKQGVLPRLKSEELYIRKYNICFWSRWRHCFRSRTLISDVSLFSLIQLIISREEYSDPAFTFADVLMLYILPFEEEFQREIKNIEFYRVWEE